MASPGQAQAGFGTVAGIASLPAAMAFRGNPQMSESILGMQAKMGTPQNFIDAERQGFGFRPPGPVNGSPSMGRPQQPYKTLVGQ